MPEPIPEPQPDLGRAPQNRLFLLMSPGVVSRSAGRSLRSSDGSGASVSTSSLSRSSSAASPHTASWRSRARDAAVASPSGKRGESGRGGRRWEKEDEEIDEDMDISREEVMVEAVLLHGEVNIVTTVR